MKTLQERFKSNFVLFTGAAWTEDKRNSILTFIKQELMLLAKEVEGTLRTRYHDKSDQDRQDKGHNIGVVNAAAIIRTRADEI